MQSVLAMDKAEVEGESLSNQEYKNDFPVFENFPLIASIQFYLAQQVQNQGESRYFAQEKEASDAQSSEPCTSLEAALELLATQKGEKWVECDASQKFKVKKCHHRGMLKQPVSMIFFECKQFPSADFLKQILPLATDDGPYQMVRVVTPRGNISSGSVRNLERSAQGKGFTFLGRRGPLEWRRLSEKVFQAKIKRHSLGAAKRGKSRKR